MTHKIGKKSCPWRGIFAVFLEEVGDAEGLGVVVALKVVDAEGFHLVGHFFCFYAFGGDHEAQGMHGGDEVRKVGVGMAAVVFDEGDVDLDLAEGEVFHAAGVGVAGAVVVEDDVEAHFLEEVDLLFPVRVERSVFDEFEADGEEGDEVSAADFVQVVGKVEVQTLGGSEVDVDPVHVAAGKAACADELAGLIKDLIVEGVDDADGVGELDKITRRYHSAVVVTEAREGFCTGEFFCLGIHERLKGDFDGVGFDGFAEDFADVGLALGALFVFLVDDDVLVLEGVDVVEGKLQRFAEFGRAGVVEAVVDVAAADVKGGGFAFPDLWVLELLMDFGNGRMNVHEARGNDEEMAVIEIEAVFLRKFVPDVFAEMGKVVVDDGASVGDAALVVAADGKSEAAGLMVFQRLFHEEIEGSTGEEAGFLVLEEVRVPDGDVNTENAECDEEGQEKGLPVDGFEDGAGGNQGAGEEEAVDLFFVFLVFRCSRCDEAEDEVEEKESIERHIEGSLEDAEVRVDGEEARMPWCSDDDDGHHRDGDGGEREPFLVDPVSHVERFHCVAEGAESGQEGAYVVKDVEKVDQPVGHLLPVRADGSSHDAKEDGDEGHDHRVPEIEGIFQRDFAVLHIEMKEEKEDRNRGKAEIHVPVAKEIPDRVHFTRLLSMTSAQKQRTLKPAGYIKKV